MFNLRGASGLGEASFYVEDTEELLVAVSLEAILRRKTRIENSPGTNGLAKQERSRKQKLPNKACPETVKVGK